MDMKIMNGDSKLVSSSSVLTCLAIGVIVFFQLKSNKKLKTHCSEASIQQYMNRLTEFFDSDQLQDVKKEFLEMIDYGFYPINAFKMLTFNGELN